jgi:hypothetical protein
VKKIADSTQRGRYRMAFAAVEPVWISGVDPGNDALNFTRSTFMSWRSCFAVREVAHGLDTPRPRILQF